MTLYAEYLQSNLTKSPQNTLFAGLKVNKEYSDAVRNMIKAVGAQKLVSSQVRSHWQCAEWFLFLPVTGRKGFFLLFVKHTLLNTSNCHLSQQQLTTKRLNQTTQLRKAAGVLKQERFCSRVLLSFPAVTYALSLLHFWHCRYIPITQSLRRNMKTNAKGQKHFCRLPRKRNALFNIMDGIWTQTNGSSIDFSRDEVSLQLFSHRFSVVPVSCTGWKPQTC